MKPDCQCSLDQLYWQGESPICKTYTRLDYARYEHEMDSCSNCGHRELCHGEFEKQRTDQQRKSIELFCKKLAKALNDSGQDQRIVMSAMKDGVQIPWDQDAVKNVIWRLIQIAMTNKKSTTELTPKQVSEVYEVVNRYTAERHGVSIPFPDRFQE